MQLRLKRQNTLGGNSTCIIAAVQWWPCRYPNSLSFRTPEASLRQAAQHLHLTPPASPPPPLHPAEMYLLREGGMSGRAGFGAGGTAWVADQAIGPLAPSQVRHLQLLALLGQPVPVSLQLLHLLLQACFVALR